MATSKTLTPTNTTISIPAMSDRPNQSVNSNCIDKEADAINKLDGDLSFFKRGAHLANGTDLNSVTTPGKYYSASTSETETMSHCPATGGFSLVVVIHGYDWVNQYWTNVSGTTIYHRRYSSTDGWDSWKSMTWA